MAATTPLDIPELRHRHQLRRDELLGRRPALALKAASGDASAIEQARHLTAELADLAAQMEGLDLAEREQRRLEAVRKQEAEAAARQRTAERIAGLRDELRDELLAIEPLLVELGAHATRVDGLALELDGLEANPTTPPYRRRWFARRVVGRALAALNCWPAMLPGGQDPKPLGAADVP